MTAGENALWIAVYASSWHVSIGRLSPGSVTDDERARWCMAQADRALKASLLGSRSLSDHAWEVLG
jgi:hypothetical protein